jgi:cysteine desulfurase/selenocysteine lyase
VHILVDGRIVERRHGAGHSSSRGLRGLAHPGGRDRRHHPDAAVSTLDVAAEDPADFPILQRTIHGRRWCTSTRPPRRRSPGGHRRDDRYYETINANVHRGVYALAEGHQRHGGRPRAGGPLHRRARPGHEVVFTKNATESLNLVARSVGRRQPRPGRRRGAHPDGAPRQHRAVASSRPRRASRSAGSRSPRRPARPHRPRPAARRREGVFSLTAMSNVLGTITPVRERWPTRPTPPARWWCVDACQYVPHLATDVQALGADFLAFSGHKMLGPTGIGVLWGREELLDAMPPFLGGGGMILDVTPRRLQPADLPAKFEAGTPPIAEAVGLGAAVDYLDGLGMDAVRRTRSSSRPTRCAPSPSASAQLTIHGPAEPAMRGGVLSLAFGDIHPHDLSQVLDQHAVCVRAGHHCAKPLMRVLGVGATARASFYVYNDDRRRRRVGRCPRRSGKLLLVLTGARAAPAPTTGRSTHARTRGSLPRDHPRPLPQPPEPGRAGRRRPPPHRGVQPAVRRRDRGLPAARPRGHAWPTSASAAPAARSASRRPR